MRLHARLQAPVVFVIGATGAGKSTLVRHALDEDGASARIVTAGRDWQRPEVAARMLAEATRGRPASLAIDDAHHLIGSASERVLEGFLAEGRVPRVVVASRTMPSFEVKGDALVSAPELAFRLDEVVALVRAHGGPRIELETASRLRAETAGWAEPIRLLARVAERVDPDSLDREMAATLGGDFAAVWLERVLAELQPRVEAALAASSGLPSLDLARCSRLLDETDGAALIRALDDGEVMHGRAQGGRRALPPVLRRHLLARMSPSARVAAGEAAARVLLEDQAMTDAADALTHGGAWPSLGQLLEAEPAAGRSPGRWSARVPAHVGQRTPAIGDAVERARAGERLALVGTRSRRAALTSRAPIPTATLDRGSELLASAAACLRRGDATGAVPLLRRALRAAEAPEESVAARLALAVLRVPLASTATTMQALCALEADAVDLGLPGLARVIRGAIAANCLDAPRRAVREVVERCELYDDDLGAAIVEGIDVLAQLRRGVVDVAQAIDFAERCDRLGEAEAAAWARAAAVLGAAAARSPRLPDLVTTAEASAVATGLEGPRALLAAAAALTCGGEDAVRHAASAHRIARLSGLPRVPLVPSLVPRVPTDVVIARPAMQERPHDPALAVSCFGGFRVRIDGADADLRGLRPQARSLLRMLALNAGAPLHRELIADALWGELGTESALHALHVSISSLRRVLPLDDGSSRFVVERDGEAYRLGIADRGHCDLSDFDDHLAAAATAKSRGDLASAASGLRHALGLYTGDVLPEDGPAEWAIGARERYRLRAAEAANSLSHLEAHLGDTRAAVAAASRAVEIDPWLDESWRTLVRMHRHAGDDVAALRAHDGYHRMREALGIE